VRIRSEYAEDGAFVFVRAASRLSDTLSGLKLRPDFFVRLPDCYSLASREADYGRIRLINVFLHHHHMILIQKDGAQLSACIKLNQLGHELSSRFDNQSAALSANQ
jgi:hypothetical protein